MELLVFHKKAIFQGDSCLTKIIDSMQGLIIWRLLEGQNVLIDKRNLFQSNFFFLQDYAESTMNELLGLYGFEKFDSTETEHLNVDRFTKADDRLSPVDDASRDDVSIDSCDSSSGRSDLSKYNRSKFFIWYFF